MIKRHFNGIVPSPQDDRDYKFSDLVPLSASVKLPRQYESPMTPFVYDQGISNECAACAYNTIRYLQESNTENGGSGIDEPFSPSFNYANRIEGEDFEGMYLRSVCKKGKEGSIPYRIFPGFYTYHVCKAKFEENAEYYKKMAEPFKITSYYQCNDRTSVMRAIMETGGVITGVWVYESLYNPDDKGVIHYDPKTDTENYGGHAITIVGWKWEKENDKDKLYWRIQNSWGVNWGDNGRAWLPYEYPWVENAWAIVDLNTKLKWENYKKQFKL